MVNTSGIIPVGHRILVLPNQIQSTTKSGIIVHTETQKEREALGQMYGVVVAMGDSVFADQHSQWCKVGDRVSFGRYSGLIYTGVDEKTYRVINDLDIVAIVEEEVK